MLFISITVREDYFKDKWVTRVFLLVRIISVINFLTGDKLMDSSFDYSSSYKVQDQYSETKKFGLIEFLVSLI